MSQAEVERFVKDLAKEGSLLENLKQSATGLAPIVAVGKSQGYDFTLDEVRSCIRVPGRHELMQLDAIVGDKQDLSGAGLSRIVHTTALASSTSEAPASAVQAAEAGRDLVAIVLLIVVVVAVAA
ncbi:Nif11-like leader peptide family natural product precursor [Bradyrhizobium vignae]|uniref:Nif11-like leader peptide family natural product n=1 Tax=Bradyrhizobium vignae TaxID=1549949 RepID=A0ABS4A4Q8_9BRAD|nr:Nif11-like leader peptide family natural product precursor [Bradyrhizobium vignae]MBP0114928.1 Nif11-like leader peptide family natural product precursor [Bradyrhizobium vignae]